MIAPAVEPTPYRCACGQPVYLRNHSCLNCKQALGYDPEHDRMVRLTPQQKGRWTASDGAANLYVRCANLESPPQFPAMPSGGVVSRPPSAG